MSTPNFALKNASRYFVIGMPVYYTQEDIDANDMDQELLGEYDEIGTETNFEAAKNNVAYELNAKDWQNIDECDGDRSYPTSLFSEKTITLNVGNVDIDITVQVGYTSGYYQGANFDWLAKVGVSGMIEGWNEQLDYGADELEAGDVIRDNWYNNRGLSRIHAEHIIEKIGAIIDTLKEEAEIAFSKYCDEELFCAWRSFNGEAGYKEAGKRLWQELEDQNKKTA